MVRNTSIIRLRRILSLFRKSVGKQEKPTGEYILEESSSRSNSVDDTAHEHLTTYKHSKFSEADKLNFKDYSRALLCQCTYTENEQILKEIAKEENAKCLKNVFFPNCFIVLLKEKNSKENNVREKYEKCIYKLFMLFTNPRFASESHSIDILDWLADQKEIEKIIYKRDHAKMIHWLASSNNLYGVEWAFDKYLCFLDKSELREIFEVTDNEEQNIFDCVANGIIAMEKSNLSSQAEVIHIVIEQFIGITGGSENEKKQKASEKIEHIRSMLLGIELTQELEKQLTIENYIEK